MMYYCKGSKKNKKPCPVESSSWNPIPKNQCDYCWAVDHDEPKEEIERLKRQALGLPELNN